MFSKSVSFAAKIRGGIYAPARTPLPHRGPAGAPTSRLRVYPPLMQPDPPTSGAICWHDQRAPAEIRPLHGTVCSTWTLAGHGRGGAEQGKGAVRSRLPHT